MSELSQDEDYDLSNCDIVEQENLEDDQLKPAENGVKVTNPLQTLALQLSGRKRRDFGSPPPKTLRPTTSTPSSVDSFEKTLENLLKSEEKSEEEKKHDAGMRDAKLKAAQVANDTGPQETMNRLMNFMMQQQQVAKNA